MIGQCFKYQGSPTILKMKDTIMEDGIVKIINWGYENQRRIGGFFNSSLNEFNINYNRDINDPLKIKLLPQNECPMDPVE